MGEKNNVNYKAHAYLHKKAREFNAGDYVMVQIRLKRYPFGIVKKLHACSARPFQNFKKD